MKGTHGKRHEALLERWLAGEELKAAENGELRACTVCMERQSELEELVGELDAGGEAQRERDVAAALASPPLPNEAKVLLALEQEMARSAPRGGLPRILLFAPAAAALVAALLGLWFVRSYDKPEPFYLQQEGIADMAPAGNRASDELRWSYELPHLGSYEVELYRPGEATPFHRAIVHEPVWTPDVPLPEHYFWEVRAFDAAGTAVAFGRVEVLPPRR